MKAKYSNNVTSVTLKVISGAKHMLNQFNSVKVE